MDDIDSNRLGVLIREARMRLRLSQAQLADQLGVTRQTVSLWEKGETTPQHLQLDAIVNVLGLEIPTGRSLPKREGIIAATDARGVRIAALRMSEVVTQLLRDAVEAEADFPYQGGLEALAKAERERDARLRAERAAPPRKRGHG